MSAQTAQPDEALAKVLAMPISPGAIALLVRHSTQPAAINRLADALADQRPDVRAVAARIAFTTRHGALAPALARALAKETHPVAGAEIVRALSLIRGPAADTEIASALPNLDARAAAAFRETTGRTRATSLLTQLETLPDRLSIGGELFSAVVGHPEAAARAFAPLPQTPALERAYLALVGAARQRLTLPPWSVLTAGLATPGRARVATYALLLDARAADRELPPEAKASLRELPREGSDGAAIAVFAELRGRRSPSGKSLVETIGRIDPLAVPPGFFFQPVFTFLKTDEQAAVARLAGPDWKPIEPLVGRRTANAAIGPVEEPGDSMTRLSRPLSRSLLDDLLIRTGCTATPGRIAIVELTYRPTGQVRGVAMIGGPTGDCAEAATILAALEIAPGDEPVTTTRTDRVVIGLRPSDLECDRQPAERGGPPLPLGATVKAPVKTRNVSPVYPQSAVSRGTQGVVFVQAVIPRTGCVADAFVTKSLDPLLDLAALAAIGEWRYSPAIIDGEPVTVIMFVTVNFSLR